MFYTSSLSWGINPSLNPLVRVSSNSCVAAGMLLFSVLTSVQTFFLICCVTFVKMG